MDGEMEQITSLHLGFVTTLPSWRHEVKWLWGEDCVALGVVARDG